MFRTVQHQPDWENAWLPPVFEFLITLTYFGPYTALTQSNSLPRPSLNSLSVPAPALFPTKRCLGNNQDFHNYVDLSPAVSLRHVFF